MRSNTSSPGDVGDAVAAAVAELSRAIDDCAMAAQNSARAADNSATAAEPDLTGRLVALWAMLADVDPEMAARVARYTVP